MSQKLHLRVIDGTELCNVETSGNASNGLNKQNGTTVDGVFYGTEYELEKNVVLYHDVPWSVEWTLDGNPQNGEIAGGALLSDKNVNIYDDINAYIYIYR